MRIILFFLYLLPVILEAQVRFDVSVLGLSQDESKVLLKGYIASGWRLYADSFRVETSSPLSGSPVMSTSQKVNDAFFGGKIRIFSGRDIQWEGVVKQAKDMPLQVHVKYFVADAENFLPVDTLIVINAEKRADGAFAGIGRSKLYSDCGVQPLEESSPVLVVFIKGFMGGLLALLMPCIFPMIPVTVSFFTGKSNAIRNSFLFGLFITLIYAAASLPFHLFSGVDPQILNTLSTGVGVNLVFFAVFVVFALSLLGLFQLRLPPWLANTAGSNSGAGSIAGIFFMALTLCVISFSCTGPILGFLLANTITDGAWYLSTGLTGFGIALALPFSLFATFPRWMKALPRSGSWMDTVKKSFAFVELAFALKFLSNADLVAHWGILRREIFLLLWFLIAAGFSVFLSGLFDKVSFPPMKVACHTEGKNGLINRLPLPVVRPAHALAVIVSLFAVSLLPGVLPKPPKYMSWMSGFLPPYEYSIYKREKEKDRIMPDVVNDFDQALTLSKKTGKPILIDFTGWACVNCRRMEEQVWIKPEIYALLKEKFVLVSLYVDDRKKLQRPVIYEDRVLSTVGQKWADFQSANFKQVSQPLYAIVSPSGELLNAPVGYTAATEWKAWLECGLENFYKIP